MARNEYTFKKRQKELAKKKKKEEKLKQKLNKRKNLSEIEPEPAEVFPGIGLPDQD